MAVLLPARKDVQTLREAAVRRRAMVAGRLYRPFFTEDQMRELVTYKNRGVDRSITYKLILSRLYDRLVCFLPKWLAPNAVTLIGFALVIISHIFVVWHASAALDAPSPAWVYVFAAIALFTYMVLDNLDGRQARRTRSSSPLGHLFDHGCDAFNVTISAITVIGVLQLGQRPLWAYLMLFFSGHVVCYVAALEEYFTGALVLREINGPNEGLIVISLCHLFTGILGPNIWTRSAFRLGGVDWAWNQVVVSAITLAAALTVWVTLAAILRHDRCKRVASSDCTVLRVSPLQQPAQRHDVGKKPHAQLLRALLPLLQCGLIHLAWIGLGREDFMRHALSILWLSCIQFYYMISRIMVCHLTKGEFPWLTGSLVPQALCMGNAVIGRAVVGRSLLPQGWVLCVMLCVVSGLNGWRIVCMIWQICEFLNIHCLRLGPRRALSGEVCSCRPVGEGEGEEARGAVVAGGDGRGVRACCCCVGLEVQGVVGCRGGLQGARCMMHGVAPPRDAGTEATGVMSGELMEAVRSGDSAVVARERKWVASCSLSAAAVFSQMVGQRSSALWRRPVRGRMEPGVREDLVQSR